ncbi:MAG: hypothetical protein COA57_06610 [Flavobacteriales bacterium]|nr:hypothetical protein [Bacteroidales bacterium AH-315-I05]PCJ86184.1 MAG: hypothetical protein COA57_06610 [Flavobacteriales bacterium]
MKKQKIYLSIISLAVSGILFFDANGQNSICKQQDIPIGYLHSSQFGTFPLNKISNAVKSDCISQSKDDFHVAKIKGKVKIYNALTKEEVSVIVRFTAKEVGGKVYLNWYTREDDESGLFVVEHSENGVDFQPIGFKNRFETPANMELLFSLIDEEPKRVSHYRVLALGNNGTYSYSQSITIAITENTSAASTELSLK